MSGLKEVVPKSGLLFQDQSLHPVLCKPKLMPLKSVTLEKLERMQKEAQEKVWETEMSTGLETKERPSEGETERGPERQAQADIWRADEDGQSDLGD